MDKPRVSMPLGKYRSWLPRLLIAELRNLGYTVKTRTAERHDSEMANRVLPFRGHIQIVRPCCGDRPICEIISISQIGPYFGSDCRYDVLSKTCSSDVLVETLRDDG